MKNDKPVYADGKLCRQDMMLFPIGTIGRDAACAGLFMNQLLNYVYFTKKLTNAQMTAITVLMAAAKIFDAINDLVMGNIVDATKSKWGKFKPWIFLGMIGSSIVVVASFSNTLQGWSYVAFFGILYFAFSIVFTMNDIGYWSMVPSLARDPSDRDKLSSRTAFCANIGGGLNGILVPILTTGELAIGGSAVASYRYLSIIFVAIFIFFQMIMLIGTKEDYSLYSEKKQNISVKYILNIFKTNDQLRWIAVAFCLTQMAPTACTSMYVYFQFGYNGTLNTLFGCFGGLATVIINIFYPKFAEKHSRLQLLRLSAYFSLLGNLLIVLFGVFYPAGGASIVIPFFNAEITMQYLLEVLSNFFVGFANTMFYMIMMISISNTAEYNEYLTGVRNEGIIFSTRTFLTKFGSAVNTLVVMLFYVIIGINSTTNQISDLEQQANMGLISGEEKLSKIKTIISNVPESKTISLLLLFTVATGLLYYGAYLVYKKKYKISEDYYKNMTAELEKRRELRKIDEEA